MNADPATTIEPATPVNPKKQAEGQSESWELSKENYVPVRTGRKKAVLAELTDPADSHTKQALELKRRELWRDVQEYAGEDPLEPWLKIIKWTLEHATGGKTELQSLLESCTSELMKVPSYKSDQRCLRLWIQYADCLPDPNDVFLFLKEQQIGLDFALYYEAYATFHELRGNCSAADAVYQDGIRRKARPIERLKQKLSAFQNRMAQRIQRRIQEEALAGGPVPDEPVRASLAPLVPVRPGAAAGPGGLGGVGRGLLGALGGASHAPNTGSTPGLLGISRAPGPLPGFTPGVGLSQARAPAQQQPQPSLLQRGNLFSANPSAAGGGSSSNVPVTPAPSVPVAMDAEFQGPGAPQALPGYSLMPQGAAHPRELQPYGVIRKENNAKPSQWAGTTLAPSLTATTPVAPPKLDICIDDEFEEESEQRACKAAQQQQQQQLWQQQQQQQGGGAQGAGGVHAAAAGPPGAQPSQGAGGGSLLQRVLQGGAADSACAGSLGAQGLLGGLGAQAAFGGAAASQPCTTAQPPAVSQPFTTPMDPPLSAQPPTRPITFGTLRGHPSPFRGALFATPAHSATAPRTALGALGDGGSGSGAGVQRHLMQATPVQQQPPGGGAHANALLVTPHQPEQHWQSGHVVAAGLAHASHLPLATPNQPQQHLQHKFGGIASAGGIPQSNMKLVGTGPSDAYAPTRAHPPPSGPSMPMHASGSTGEAARNGITVPQQGGGVSAVCVHEAKHSSGAGAGRGGFSGVDDVSFEEQRAAAWWQRHGGAAAPQQQQERQQGQGGSSVQQQGQGSSSVQQPPPQQQQQHALAEQRVIEEQLQRQKEQEKQAVLQAAQPQVEQQRRVEQDKAEQQKQEMARQLQQMGQQLKEQKEQQLREQQQKEKQQKEQQQKEQQQKEQQLKAQQLQEQQQKGQQLKEQQQREQQQKEQQLKAQRLKEQQQKEQRLKEQQQREQQLKEQHFREQQQKEQQLKEQLQKEQQLKEQQQKEQQLKEQQQREQQLKEQHLREQQQKEQQLKEQLQKEQQLKEHQQKEQQLKEQQQREQQLKEQQQKEQQLKEQQQKEQQQQQTAWGSNSSIQGQCSYIEPTVTINTRAAFDAMNDMFGDEAAARTQAELKGVHKHDRTGHTLMQVPSLHAAQLQASAAGTPLRRAAPEPTVTINTRAAFDAMNAMFGDGEGSGVAAYLGQQQDDTMSRLPSLPLTSKPLSAMDVCRLANSKTSAARGGWGRPSISQLQPMRDDTTTTDLWGARNTSGMQEYGLRADTEYLTRGISVSLAGATGGARINPRGSSRRSSVGLPGLGPATTGNMYAGLAMGGGSGGGMGMYEDTVCMGLGSLTAAATDGAGQGGVLAPQKVQAGGAVPAASAVPELGVNSSGELQMHPQQQLQRHAFGSQAQLHGSSGYQQKQHQAAEAQPAMALYEDTEFFSGSAGGLNGAPPATSHALGSAHQHPAPSFGASVLGSSTQHNAAPAPAYVDGDHAAYKAGVGPQKQHYVGPAGVPAKGQLPMRAHGVGSLGGAAHGGLQGCGDKENAGA